MWTKLDYSMRAAWTVKLQKVSDARRGTKVTHRSFRMPPDDVDYLGIQCFLLALAFVRRKLTRLAHQSPTWKLLYLKASGANHCAGSEQGRRNERRSRECMAGLRLHFVIVTLPINRINKVV